MEPVCRREYGRAFWPLNKASHHTLDVSGNEVVVQYNEPSLQKKMIELHMGHGPVDYKTYQKIFAARMLRIILSGLWAGLSSTKLRGPTAAVAAGGLLVFAHLAMSRLQSLADSLFDNHKVL